MSDTATHIPSRDEILRELSDIHLTQARDPSEENARNLRRLVQAIRNAEGSFALIFAVCNDRREQRRLGRSLNAQLANSAVDVVLTGSEPSILDVLSAAPDSPRPLFVYGVEQLLPSGDEGLRRRENTLHELQLRREQFRGLGRPLLLWLPEYAYTIIGQQAVDFWSWQSGGFFFADSAKPSRKSSAPSPRRDVSNLPALDRIYVRHPEIEAALRIVRAHRNLNLVGEAGTGKTFLAVALAEELKKEFPDGRLFVDIDQVEALAAQQPEDRAGVVHEEVRPPAERGCGYDEIVGPGITRKPPPALVPFGRADQRHVHTSGA